MDANTVREETKKHLGADVDLSYITQELLKQISSAKRFEAASPWVTQGNSITVSGGTWYWKDQCGDQWFSYPNQLDFSGIGNCPNGRQLFKIWPR
jgi:hypothetical protein